MAEHPERELSRLAAGLLEPAERAHLAEHARTCARCGPTFERSAALERTLEGDAFAPSEGELAHLEARGLERALASARPARAPWFAWLGRLSIGLAAAAALLLAVLYLRPRPGAVDEFQSRGGGAGRSTLRVFCAAPGRPVTELREGDACPRGATLAFAAAAPAELGYAAVEVRGPGGAHRSEALGVRGRPGSEAPLEFTVRLDFEPGPVDVAVGFGGSAEAANAARFEPPPAGAERRALRLTEAAP